ncbi:uncharacterized protein LOC26528551 isoform X2 [Drosophila mojavensis]|uniref:Uncharacterized protein, isoform B n=1 Tax=Drosophila mojavensis TaxID=7230 RepID=A0A0Q9XDL1_DROMO|nr:uncharacterized protein LOC26528551 isoform X2 [Drosophila mojavensis]KRG06678.1 uncharacterized protein Dmoj_GI26910, isoform B [Drosophila mojavensis]
MQVLSLLLLLFASGTVSGSYGENGKISGAGVDSSNKLSSKLNEGYRFKGIGSSKVGNQVEVVTIAVSVIRTEYTNQHQLESENQYAYMPD